ncbi:hypothetical protein [Thermoleptolyngbya sp.]
MLARVPAASQTFQTHFPARGLKRETKFSWVQHDLDHFQTHFPRKGTETGGKERREKKEKRKKKKENLETPLERPFSLFVLPSSFFPLRSSFFLLRSSFFVLPLGQDQPKKRGLNASLASQPPDGAWF